MKKNAGSEKEKWRGVMTLMGNDSLRLGPRLTSWIRKSPEKLVFSLARYKFAAKMGSAGREILEWGCGEGTGAPILSELAKGYMGIDAESEAVSTARRLWTSKKRRFLDWNLLGNRLGDFDTIVSLGLVDSLPPRSYGLFFRTLALNLRRDGIAVVGAANKAALPAQSLKKKMREFFENVFLFAVDGETVHTGVTPSTRQVIALACNKRK